MRWISRHRAAAAAIVVVGLGAMSLSACGTASDEQQADVIVGGITSDDGAGAILARASESTSAVESGRIRMTFSMSGTENGEAFSFTTAGSGSFTDFGARSELTTEMSGGPAGGTAGESRSVVMHEIFDGTATYLKVDGGDAVPGLGNRWTKLDVSGPSGASGSGVGEIVAWGGLLDSLKGAGASVAEAGTGTIDGTPVTLYTGTIDPEAARAAAAPDESAGVESALDQVGGSVEMPFTVWVDGDGMVRRLEVRVSADQAGAATETTMTLELYDFGAPVTIEIPTADEVIDFSGLSGLGAVFGPETGTA